MITFVRYISIAVNAAFIVFLVFLINDQAGTLRWVHGVNQLWFILGAVVIIVLAALLAEWFAHRKPKAPPADQAAGQGGTLRPAA